MTLRAGAPQMITLFWDKTGPKLTYDDGILHISDLNPEVETR
jgi:hypothetical protein